MAASKPVGASVSDILKAAANRAILDGLSECARAEGKRGMVHLDVELCLGDGGEALWVSGAVFFRQKRHQKDAARETSVE
jgi:hypothetical protein